MSGNCRVGFRLYLITDRKAVRSGSLLEVCAAALLAAREAAPPGTVALQLREKDLDAREVYDLARRLRQITRAVGAPLIINERVDIAIAVDADGVHLPSDSIGAGAARKVLGPDRLIGVSTHSEPDVVSVSREGQADFAVFGPVYEPLSKGVYAPVRGPNRLFEVCKVASIPVFALGGISILRSAELFADPRSRKLAGVAAIGAIIGAESPARSMRRMLETLNASAKQ